MKITPKMIRSMLSATSNRTAEDDAVYNAMQTKQFEFCGGTRVEKDAIALHKELPYCRKTSLKRLEWAFFGKLLRP